MAAKTLDVDQAKALAYQTLTEDGLVDLFCGLGLLLLGIGWWFDAVAVTAGVPAILVPLWLVARRAISRPRLGSVTLREDTQKGIARGLAVIILMGAVVLAAFVYFSFGGYGEPGEVMRNLVPALPALLLALMANVAWIFLRTSRFLLYAAGLTFAAVVVTMTRSEPYVGFLIGAVLPIMCGTAALAIFLRDNPVIDA